MASRKESIEIRVNQLNDLLDQWEEHRLTARDPSEILRSEKEISRIKSYLDQYHQELSGQGKKVVEDAANPITRPDIARLNRNWILSILLALLLITTGFLTYQSITKVAPNYDKYLEYLQAGDKLIEDRKYSKALIAYEKALDYFPADTAVRRKVDLLREANKISGEGNFNKLNELFSLILKVPAGSEIAFTNEHGSTPAPDQIVIQLQWNSQILIMTIRGGTPFAGKNNPYQIGGISCKDCISWEKTTGGAYQARIDGPRILHITALSVRDSKGLTQSTQIPDRPDSGRTEAPEENKSADPAQPIPESKPEDPSIKEEHFKGLVESADQYFKDKKFVKAKDDYTAALVIKPGNAHVRQRIKECEAEINKELLKEAKTIANVAVPAGTFTMGTNDKGFPQDGPEHQVSLKKFRISKYEITVKQFRLFCHFTGRSMPPQPPYGSKDSYPITNVSWFDANAYCNWVGGRLPTEAEWEYAAREGGGMANYSGGNQLSRIAVYSGNSNGMPKPVGSKNSNGFGIYDMTGNVAEWCNDWWNNKKYSAEATTDPKGLDSGKFKIIRGGNFNSDPNSTQDGDALRTTYRNSDRPESRHEYLGFRVVW